MKVCDINAWTYFSYVSTINHCSKVFRTDTLNAFEWCACLPGCCKRVGRIYSVLGWWCWSFKWHDAYSNHLEAGILQTPSTCYNTGWQEQTTSRSKGFPRRLLSDWGAPEPIKYVSTVSRRRAIHYICTHYIDSRSAWWDFQEATLDEKDSKKAVLRKKMIERKLDNRPDSVGPSQCWLTWYRIIRLAFLWHFCAKREHFHCNKTLASFVLSQYNQLQQQ